MFAKRILDRTGRAFWLVLVGMAATALVAVYAATAPAGKQKAVNQKAAAFMAMQMTDEPTYALNPTPAQQMDAATVTHVSGMLTGNQTWSPAGGVYVVDDNVIVPAGKTLTINAGTVIKVAPNRTGIVMQEGTLRLNGTSANPIIMTSLRDDTVGGDLNEDGPSYGSWNDYGGSIGGRGTVTVKFSILRYGGVSVSASCYAGIGSWLLTDNVFNNAVQTSDCALGKVAMSRNQFGVQAASAISTYNTEVSGISMVGTNKNTFLLPNEGQAVELSSSYVSQAASWTVAPGQVLVPNALYVEGTVTLFGGTVVKLHPNTNGFQVSSTGTFNASGTGTSTVQFTSLHDDTIGGDTSGDGESYGSLRDYGSAVITGGTTKLVKAVVSYASTGVSASCSGGQTQSLIINNSTFNSTLGIYSCDNGKAVIDRNIFNVPNDYALDVSNSDITKIALSGSLRNTFTGEDKGRVAHFYNSYVPEGFTWAVDGNGGQTMLLNYLHVAGSATVGSGVIVKTVMNGWGFDVAQTGTLNVAGTGGLRAIFTSIKDDSVGGDSGGDGASSGQPGDYDQAINASGVVNVRYANMRNMNTAISAYCPNGLSSLDVSDTYVRSNISISSCGADKVSLKRNSFTIDREVALNVSNSSLDGIVLTGADRNIFNGRSARNKAINIHNSNVPAGRTWELSGAGGAQPVVSSLRVQGTLNVAAGTVVKVNTNNEGIAAYDGGDVNINGTAAQRVTFTSLKDDSINGDTGGDGTTAGDPEDAGNGLTVGLNTAVRYASFRNFYTAMNGSCQPTVGSLIAEDSIFNSPVSLYQCHDMVPVLKRNQFAVAGPSAPLTVTQSEASGIAMSGADANSFSGTGVRKTVVLNNAYIAAGRTWQVSAAPGAVLVTSSTNVSGAMKLDPGVIVKTQTSNTGIVVQHGAVFDAIGSVISPIIFTSIKDDSVGGDSGGDGPTTANPSGPIAIRTNGTTTVRYATMRNLNPAVSTICDGYADSHLEMTDNSLASNLSLAGCGIGVVTLKRNQFNVAIGPAILLYGMEVSGVAMAGADKNTFAGTGVRKTVQINGSIVEEGKTWDVDGSAGAILTSGTLYINGTVNMGPGLVVKAFTNYSPVHVGQSGHLNVNGTSGSPVTFTSLKDDSVGGDSGGDGPTSGALRDSGGIRAGGETRIHHMVIRNNSPAIDVNCIGSPQATYLEVTDSQLNGMANIAYCQTGAVKLERNQFASPFGTPLTVSGTEMSGIIFDGANKNTFTGTDAKRAVHILGGVVEQGRSWTISPDAGAVFVVDGLYVPGNVIVKGGSIIKVSRFSNGFDINDTSNLTFTGTAGSRVIMTSVNDDTVGGDSLGDKATTSPAKGDYGYGVRALGSNADLSFKADYLTVKYPATAFHFQNVKEAALQQVTVEQAQVGVYLNSGVALYRGSFVNTDRGVQSCNWGQIPGCSVDASYTDWGNAAGPLSCGAVLTDHWRYGGTTHDFSIFGSLNCDGSTYDPGGDLGQAQASFSQALNPYYIDCGNGFETACEVIEMTMQCLAAARQLAIDNSTFPINPEDVAPATIEFGADTYMDSVAEEFPSFNNQYKAATGILQVVSIFLGLSNAYGQCHP